MSCQTRQHNAAGCTLANGLENIGSAANLDHPAMLDLLKRYPSPAQLSTLSQKQLANRLVKLASRMGNPCAAEILQALSEQTVVLLGTQAARVVLPRLAQQLAALRIQRDEVAKEVERLVPLTLFIGS
jgi:hypothetical protein